jgi:hypothetical protein
MGRKLSSSGADKVEGVDDTIRAMVADLIHKCA